MFSGKSIDSWMPFITISALLRVEDLEPIHRLFERHMHKDRRLFPRAIVADFCEGVTVDVGQGFVGIEKGAIEIEEVGLVVFSFA
jgi:hypothetical protein